MSCPICRCNSVIEFNNELCRCSQCQCLFRKNVDEVNSKKLIDEIYNTSWVSMRKNYFDKTLAQHALFYEMILRFIKKGKGDLLEVGCGTGEFLYLAKNSGWNVTGFEPSKVSCNYIRDNLGIDVIESMWSLNKVLDKKYDVVFFAHVLEHIKNPIEFLTEVKSILKEDGLILLSVPNAHSIAYQDVNKGSAIYKERDHMFFYNDASIRRLFEAIGLKIKFLTTRETAGNKVNRMNADAGNREAIKSMICTENSMDGYEIIAVLEK